MCMCTHVHQCAHTFVYLCMLIKINTYGCAFLCVFLFWGWLWNCSVWIRECCGDRFCVLQNHDYFLSCSLLQGLSHPPVHSLQKDCVSVCACRSVLPPTTWREMSPGLLFGASKGLPLLHLGLWKIPQPKTAAKKNRHFEFEQHLRNWGGGWGGGAGTHAHEKFMWRCPLLYFIVLPCFIHP